MELPITTLVMPGDRQPSTGGLQFRVQVIYRTLVNTPVRILIRDLGTDPTYDRLYKICFVLPGTHQIGAMEPSDCCSTNMSYRGLINKEKCQS